MTTTKNITSEQIDALASAAAQAGDLLQHAICQLANGNEYYSDSEWLHGNTCLDTHERRRLELMTIDDAIEECARVIADFQGQS